MRTNIWLAMKTYDEEDEECYGNYVHTKRAQNGSHAGLRKAKKIARSKPSDLYYLGAVNSTAKELT